MLAVAGFGCHPKPTSLPITVTPHRELLVNVEIDGQPLVFQLDTGASRTTITPAVRDRLRMHWGIPLSGHGAGGPIDEVELQRVRWAVVGDRHFERLTVAVVDVTKAGGSQLDGMLGQDVLSFWTSELDLRERRLVMHKYEDRSWRTDDLVEIPYTTIGNGLIRLDVQLHDQPTAAILDLGAGTTVASPRAIGDLVGLYLGTMVGADGHPVPTSGINDVTIELGGLELPAQTILVADLPVFDRLGVTDRPLMILGVDALGTRKLVIAPREKRIYISRR